MAKNELDQTWSILGDINPTPSSTPKLDEPVGELEDNEESVGGGSKQDRSEHSSHQSTVVSRQSVASR